MEQQRYQQQHGIEHENPLQIGTGVRSASIPQEDGTVQIIWGSLMDDLEVAGLTVGEVQGLLQQPYGIAPDVAVNVNGFEATHETRLEAGDELEFVRSAGEKGGG